MKTWRIEALFVAAVLVSVVAATGGKPVEWVGALAVFVTFMYAQVGFRLSEAEDRRSQLEREVRSLSQRYEHAGDKPPLADVQAAEDKLALHVECYRWLGRYFLAKEVCWFIYFVWLGAWSALVGVGVFLLYPAWRRLRRRQSA